MNFCSKHMLWSSTFVLTTSAVSAAPLPDAGKLLQLQHSTIALEPTSVEIEKPQHTQALAQLDEQKVQIDHIIIQANQSIAMQELHSLVSDAEGEYLSLSDLQQLAERITRHYHQQGFPYSRAYLPAQTISQGQVIIAILEARYDQILIDNQTKIDDTLIQDILAPLKSGDLIEHHTLTQQLLLLERLHGVKTRNVMRAGREVGTVALLVTVQEDENITGHVGVDNYGNRYTNEWRTNASLSIKNLSKQNDQLRLEAMSSGRLDFGRVSYDALIHPYGTRMGTSFSHLEYRLGQHYEDLDATGQASQASIWLNHPVLLTDQAEVVLTAHYHVKQLEDDIGVAQLYRQRDIHVGQLRLDAIQKDQWYSGGMTQYGVHADFGHVNFKDAAAKVHDLATAHTQGDFLTVGAHLSRLQHLGQSPYQLHGKLYAQYSPDNLDSAQQFSIGGINGLAGYDNSALTGSSGYYASLEVTRPIYQKAQHLLHAKVYLDTASVQQQANKWLEFSADNQQQLHSAGFGINWAHRLGWLAELQVGFPLGKRPDHLTEQDDVKAWFHLSKHF